MEFYCIKNSFHRTHRGNSFYIISQADKPAEKRIPQLAEVHLGLADRLETPAVTGTGKRPI